MFTAGDMLRLARQRLGMTQKDAAAQLGVPQPVVSRLENGAATADPDLLQRASDVYHVPRSFFDLLEPVYGPPISVQPMLRGKADLSARDVDMMTAELNIRLMHLKTLMSSVDYEPLVGLPEFDIEQYGTPERIASLVRSHWRMPQGPARNVTRQMEQAGIVVAASTFGGAAISGVTYSVPSRPPLVVINALHPADRQRFTLAHELGHLVMHRFPTPAMEDEANAFASAFLMPEPEIRQAFAGRKVTLQLLAALKPEWKVAMQALLMRASGLRLISPNQARYLWQQISTHGWRTREPADLEFPREEPSVMPNIIRASLSSSRFTVAELSKVLRVYDDEFCKMYGAFESSDPTPPKRTALRIVG